MNRIRFWSVDTGREIANAPVKLRGETVTEDDLRVNCDGNVSMVINNDEIDVSSSVTWDVAK